MKRQKNETERLFAEVRGSDTVVVFYHFATFSGPRELLNETKLQLLEDYIDYLKQRGETSRLRRSIVPILLKEKRLKHEIRKSIVRTIRLEFSPILGEIETRLK